MFKEIKKYLCLTMVLICLIIFCSCQNESAKQEISGGVENTYLIKPYSEVPEGSITISFREGKDSKDSPEVIFTRFIQHSTTAVIGEYVEDKSLELSYKKFKNLGVVYGYAPDEYIYVPIHETNRADADEHSIPSGEFVEGEKYLIIAHYNDYFCDPHPEYQLSQDLFIPLDDIDNNFAGILKVELSGEADSSDLVSYVKHIAETKGYDTYNTLYIPNVFRGESLKQVIKNILPPMSNEFLTLVKDTSLANTIMIYEITWNAKRFMNSNGLLWPLFYSGVFYLLFCGILTLIFGYLEKKLDYYKA